MQVEQLYTGCLAQGAYYVESNGEAAIIDPLREVQQYIDLANSRGAKIKYIFETHFHADFVSGHVTLAQKTGASIVYGPTAQAAFDCVVAEDNQEFNIGHATIRVMHTPGHTMESSTFLLIDENGKDHAIFSGDTLFLGDVGRPDLAQKAASMTQEELAATLFKSLRTKVMTLADDVIVYPGHGAGSACGKNMSSETVGTIGNEKATNYALRSDMTEEEFVKEVTDGLLPPPQYFPMNVKMNKMGYEDVEEVISRGKTPMSPAAFEAAANETGAVIIDIRHKDEFVQGLVPRSIFIGIDGDFAPWVGALIKDVEQPILLVGDNPRIDEALTRLSRVGFDKVIGYLEGGVEAWKAAGKELDAVDSISATQFEESHPTGDAKIFDVRRKTEYEAEHVKGADNTPLDYLNDHMSTFQQSGETGYVHCKSGYRSLVAVSILKNRGIHNVVNIAGGFDALKQTNLSFTEYVCPSTLK